MKPLPPELKLTLAPTLARRVYQLREFRNMTVRDLSRSSRFSQTRIEDIEAGLETWLSVTDRQKLAKALVVEPVVLQEVESHPQLEASEEERAEASNLELAILSGARDLECPACRHTLKCSIQEGFDLEGLPIRFAKAYCTNCPFVLRRKT